MSTHIPMSLLEKTKEEKLQLYSTSTKMRLGISIYFPFIWFNKLLTITFRAHNYTGLFIAK